MTFFRKEKNQGFQNNGTEIYMNQYRTIRTESGKEGEI